MAASRVSASEVVNTLFDDEFGLSEDDNSDESNEDCIYGYLGAAVLHRVGLIFLPKMKRTWSGVCLKELSIVTVAHGLQAQVTPTFKPLVHLKMKTLMQIHRLPQRNLQARLQLIKR